MSWQFARYCEGLLELLEEDLAAGRIEEPSHRRGKTRR